MTGLHKTNRSHKNKDKYNTLHASSSCTKFFGKSNPLLISCVWLAHWADRWMIEQLQENLCNNFGSVASLWQDYCNTCNDSGHHRFFASHPCQSVDWLRFDAKNPESLRNSRQMMDIGRECKKQHKKIAWFVIIAPTRSRESVDRSH